MCKKKWNDLLTALGNSYYFKSKQAWVSADFVVRKFKGVQP